MELVLTKNGLQTIIDGVEISTMPMAVTVILFILFLGVIGTFYAFRSIAIYRLAKVRNINKAYFAWIPFLWVFPAYKLVPEFNLFGFSFKKFAFWFALVFVVKEVIIFLGNFFDFAPFVLYFLQGGEEIRFFEQEGQMYVSAVNMVNHFDVKWLNVTMLVLNYVNLPIRLVSSVIHISFYVAIFRKFWPQSYIVASILSVFGLFPIFVFIIRNKQEISYADYVRARYYNAENYNVNNNQDKELKEESPFKEFKDSKNKEDPGDPFDEF
ncbi:MAG: hypothetical protein MJ066_02020 [Clostridia bacterium]|nr:hypothetical protein [Clostridia bacterium]